MENKVKGTIKRIGEIRTISDKFKCVDLHLTTGDEYPQVLNFQMSNDKADNLIKFNKVGDKVEVSYNLRGREWTNPQGDVKVFNTLDAWKVWKLEETPQAEQVAEEVEDDLPF